MYTWREQSAKTATEVSWVHWILATGAVNEVAIQLRKKEKCFRFNLSADMHWLIVYTKFSWAWDSGRYRHKRSKARYVLRASQSFNVKTQQRNVVCNCENSGSRLNDILFEFVEENDSVAIRLKIFFQVFCVMKKRWHLR